MSVYHDNFSCWADVQKEYQMDEKEPDVIFAAYSYENYSGTSVVLFKVDDKYYLNDGSHCSCYGLEGQWNPEEYNSLDLLKKCVDKHSDYGYYEQIKEIVGKL